MTRIWSRFHVFANVLLATAVVGVPYAFGIFSLIFRKELGYSQLELSIVSSCGSSGLYAGVLCGLAIQKFGPAKVLQMGALFIFAGNLYVWLAVQKLVWHSVAPVSIAYVISQFGTSCAANVAMIVSIRIFPAEVTGQAAGLAKGYFGASSAILATVASAFFSIPSVGFILFVALALPAVLLYSSFNVNFLPDDLIPFHYETSHGYSTSLLPFAHHLLIVFAFILLLGFFEDIDLLSQNFSVALGALLCVTILSLLIMPSFNRGPRIISPDVFHSPQSMDEEGSLILPARQISSLALATSEPQSSDFARSPICSSSDRDSEKVPFLTATKKRVELKNVPLMTFNSSQHQFVSDSFDKFTEESEPLNKHRSYTAPFISFYGRHLSLSESIKTWRLYAIMVVFCILAGSGLLVINNIEAIAGAVDESPSDFFITVISFANTGGRVLVGFIADANRHRFSRFQLLAFIAIITCLTHITLSFGHSLLLYPCLLSTGAMFGATFSNIAAISSDVFGAKHVGTNYGFIDLAPALGSYVFSAGLVALFYPRTTSEAGEDYSESFCEGKSCFQNAFIVTSCSSFVAAIVSLVLHIKTPLPSAV